MFARNIRRVVGGVGVVAMAAGLAVTVGAGAASAASDKITWSDGNSKFTRTISNVDPREGDTITVSTKFQRSIALEIINEVKDYHPACLEFVSAKVDGKSKSLDSRENDWAKVKGSWTVRPYFDPKSHTFEFSYRVGANCDRNVGLKTGMTYDGSLGSGSYKTKGPKVTVKMNNTSTTLAPVPSAVVGAPVTLSATVTGGHEGDKLGFYDGDTKIGDGRLNGDGIATIEWTPATDGAHTLAAKFSETPRAKGSESATQTVTVAGPEVTATTLTGPPTALTGDELVFTAQVTPNPAGGTVQFKDGGADLGPAVAINPDGTAVLNHTFDTAGPHEIIAVYSGIPGVIGSTSANHTVAVSEGTATTLTGPTTALTGDEVAFTAQITPNPAGGTIQFKDGGIDLGPAVTVNPDGTAVLNHTFDTGGTHEIAAAFSGTPVFTESASANHSVAVSVPEVTTTTLTGPTTTMAGAEVTFTAQISPNPAGGTIQFRDGDTDLGPTVTVNPDGTATLTHTFDTAGTHEIAAAFSGTPAFVGSTSANHSVAVSEVTTTTLTGPTTAMAGTEVAFTAQITPNPAGGTIQFKNGGADLGPAVAVNPDGTANLPHTFDTDGPHQIAAVFSGVPGFIGSTSANHTVTVSVPDPADVTTTTVLTAPASAKKGAAVDLIATVSPNPAGGTVQFFDGATPIGAPAQVADGKATLSHAFAATGDRRVSAVYGGTQGFLGSTAQAVTVTVTDDGTGTGTDTGSAGNVFGS
ncbi:Ig-like domain-containing protein [Rhodococcus marinonascens]|uniref:Ig-like domain-containing protein n=1 Tax=Rhodococcus marinonascens TaxID=38311 RepID=UPI000A6917BA|nr:Ig-like domain-containing protein [Rhodococcus marinonascens]